MRVAFYLSIFSLLLFAFPARASVFVKPGGEKVEVNNASEDKLLHEKEWRKEQRKLKKEQRKARRQYRKEMKKQLKAQLRELRQQNASDSLLLLIIIAILLPPLAMFIYEDGATNRFWISLLLWLLFYVPGLIYTLVVILGEN